MEKKKNVLKRDKYDEMMMKKSLLLSDRVHEFALSNEDYKPVWELIKDTFNAFYKYMPKFENEKIIDPEYKPNKVIIDKLMKTEAYREIRNITRLDEMNSAVAVISFLQRIQEIIDELKKQPPPPPSGGQGDEDNNQNQQDMQNWMKQVQSKVKMKDIVQAMQGVKDDLSDLEEAIAGLMWSNDLATPSSLPPEERMKLASKLMRDRHLREILKMIGKFKHLAVSTYKSKVRRSPAEIYDIKTGKNLANLVPSEYVKLLEYEEIFLKDYIEGRLMEYDINDRSKMEKGDIVVCLDLSGSMAGERELWAKAVALATIEIASKERRNWVLIPFSSEVHDIFVVKSRPDPKTVMKIASYWLGGGTSFEKPLGMAMRMIKEKGFQNADILFITDGECDVSEEFEKELEEFKEKYDVKVVSVAIHTNVSLVLRRISEVVYKISDLSDREAKEIFSSF